MRRFRFPFPRPSELHRDIDDELEAHLAIAASAFEREGLSPSEARDAAVARLGDVASLHRDLYRMDRRSVLWSLVMTTLSECITDSRFALRRLRHRPMLACVTALTLAGGIGTAVTFVGAADAILLRPLPFRDADRVMTLWRSPSDDVTARSGLAPGTIADLVEGVRSFTAVAGAQPYSLDIAREGAALSIGTWRVTDGFFDILRATPALGRLLEPRDFVPGADAVVVVSHTYWRTHLGGDSAAIGRLEQLNGAPHIIRGVLPADFPLSQGRQLYVPYRIAGTFREDRVADYWSTFARLREGVAVAAGTAELRTLVARSDATAGASVAPRAVHLVPMSDALLGDVRVAIILLALGALLVLMMSVASASGMLLADTMSRAHELAIRAGVGAGRERIVRQLITESAVLVLIAAVGGLSAGAAGLRAFAMWAPASIPRLAELRVDVRVVLIAVLLALVVTILVTLASARVVRTTNLQDALRSAGDTGAASGRRTRSTLVVAQVALAVLLLCCGGLLLRSWMQLGAIDQGYRAEGVLAIENHVWGTYRTPAARATFGRALEQRLLTEPGVEAAAVATAVPLGPAIGDMDAEVRRPGAVTPTRLQGIAASPGFFGALDVTAVGGRLFTDNDNATGEPVAILSAAAATALFPDRDPIGQLLTVNASFVTAGSRRIVGVVRDVRFLSPEAAGLPTIYLPFAQAPSGSLYIVTRHSNPAPTALPSVQRVLYELLPGSAQNDVVMLADAQRVASVPRRFAVLLLTTFAMIALALTAVGLFGLLTQVVRMRARELGIRLALGASPTTLRRMMLREGLRLTVIGTCVGMAAFLIGAGTLRAFLVGVPARDPLTLTVVATLMLALAGCAAWWPAIMATRVDPLRLLRSE